MTLEELYNHVAQCRIDLGHWEDALEACCAKDKKRIQREHNNAQSQLQKAIDDLNCRLNQLGRGFISSRRSIHIIE